MKDLSLGKLSVSIGIATYPINTMLSDELTKLADIALYEAKGCGRNQACHYNDFIQTSALVDVTAELNEDKKNINENAQRPQLNFISLYYYLTSPTNKKYARNCGNG